MKKRFLFILIFLFFLVGCKSKYSYVNEIKSSIIFSSSAFKTVNNYTSDEKDEIITISFDDELEIFHLERYIGSNETLNYNNIEYYILVDELKKEMILKKISEMTNKDINYISNNDYAIEEKYTFENGSYLIVEYDSTVSIDLKSCTTNYIHISYVPYFVK